MAKKSRPRGGRPILGAERKVRHAVMLEPAVAAWLRELGGENLSRGIALVAAAVKGRS